jgi:hypothetical protein
MLQDVRANNQVVFTKGGNLIAIKIDAVEGGVGNLGQQPLFFVGEGNLATPFHKLRPENAVTAAEIERPRLSSKRNATALDPVDGILSLEQVKRWVVPLFEELGQESMDNHAGLKLRKAGSSSKTVPPRP